MRPTKIQKELGWIRDEQNQMKMKKFLQKMERYKQNQ